MILFVDDERRWTTAYREALEMAGYDVMLQTDVAGALRLLETKSHEVELLILDIMMPSSSLFADEETDSGMRTGLSFFDVIRTILPDLPVVVLTNVSDVRVATHFSRQSNCCFFRKEQCRPSRLVAEIGDLIGVPKSRE